MPGSVCVSGRGRGAARRTGARAGGGQPQHQDSARPRRLAAPPRYWSRRSRAISLRQHCLGSAAVAAPTTRRQREPREAARGRIRVPAESERPQHLPLLLLRCLRVLLAASCRRRCYRHRRSTNYIRATRTRPPSGELGSFRHTPSCPPRAARECRLRQTSAGSDPPLPPRPRLVAPRPVKPFPVAFSSL